MVQLYKQILTDSCRIKNFKAVDTRNPLILPSKFTLKKVTKLSELPQQTREPSTPPDLVTKPSETPQKTREPTTTLTW